MMPHATIEGLIQNLNELFNIVDNKSRFIEWLLSDDNQTIFPPLTPEAIEAYKDPTQIWTLLLDPRLKFLHSLKIATQHNNIPLTTITEDTECTKITALIGTAKTLITKFYRLAQDRPEFTQFLSEVTEWLNEQMSVYGLAVDAPTTVEAEIPIDARSSSAQIVKQQADSALIISQHLTRGPLAFGDFDQLPLEFGNFEQLLAAIATTIRPIFNGYSGENHPDYIVIKIDELLKKNDKFFTQAVPQQALSLRLEVLQSIKIAAKSLITLNVIKRNERAMKINWEGFIEKTKELATTILQSEHSTDQVKKHIAEQLLESSMPNFVQEYDFWQTCARSLAPNEQNIFYARAEYKINQGKLNTDGTPTYNDPDLLNETNFSEILSKIEDSSSNSVDIALLIQRATEVCPYIIEQERDLDNRLQLAKRLIIPLIKVPYFFKIEPEFFEECMRLLPPAYRLDFYKAIVGKFITAIQLERFPIDEAIMRAKQQPRSVIVDEYIERLEASVEGNNLIWQMDKFFSLLTLLPNTKETRDYKTQHKRDIEKQFKLTPGCEVGSIYLLALTAEPEKQLNVAKTLLLTISYFYYAEPWALFCNDYRFDLSSLEQMLQLINDKTETTQEELVRFFKQHVPLFVEEITAAKQSKVQIIKDVFNKGDAPLYNGSIKIDFEPQCTTTSTLFGEVIPQYIQVADRIKNEKNPLNTLTGCEQINITDINIVISTKLHWFVTHRANLFVTELSKQSPEEKLTFAQAHISALHHADIHYIRKTLALLSTPEECYSLINGLFDASGWSDNFKGIKQTAHYKTLAFIAYIDLIHQFLAPENREAAIKSLITATDSEMVNKTFTQDNFNRFISEHPQDLIGALHLLNTQEQRLQFALNLLGPIKSPSVNSISNWSPHKLSINSAMSIVTILQGDPSTLQCSPAQLAEFIKEYVRVTPLLHQEKLDLAQQLKAKGINSPAQLLSDLSDPPPAIEEEEAIAAAQPSYVQNYNSVPKKAFDDIIAAPEHNHLVVPATGPTQQALYAPYEFHMYNVDPNDDPNKAPPSPLHQGTSLYPELEEDDSIASAAAPAQPRVQNEPLINYLLDIVVLYQEERTLYGYEAKDGADQGLYIWLSSDKETTKQFYLSTVNVINEVNATIKTDTKKRSIFNETKEFWLHIPHGSLPNTAQGKKPQGTVTPFKTKPWEEEREKISKRISKRMGKEAVSKTKEPAHQKKQ